MLRYLDGSYVARATCNIEAMLHAWFFNVRCCDARVDSILIYIKCIRVLVSIGSYRQQGESSRLYSKEKQIHVDKTCMLSSDNKDYYLHVRVQGV